MYDVAVDSAGYIYTTGFFNSTTDFNPGPTVDTLTTAGPNSDVFVTKQSPDGELVWVRRLGGFYGGEQGEAITVDNMGNVYTTGHYPAAMADFDPGQGVVNLPYAGNSDMFISKLNSSGNYVWAKAIANSGTDQGQAIAVDGFQNVYAGGVVSQGMIVVKLANNGDTVWTKKLLGQGNITSIAVDNNGNVYATGQYQNTVDFDPDAAVNSSTSLGYSDGFIIKLSASGTYQWHKVFGGVGIDRTNSIRFDVNGNMLLCGEFNDVVDFDPGVPTLTISSNGSNDIYVIKLTPTGDLTWVKTFGSSGYDNDSKLTTDKFGSIYISGRSAIYTDFDPGPEEYALNGQTFISKLNSNGDFVWARTLSGNVLALGIAVDTANNVITAGSYSGHVDFDPNASEQFMNTIDSTMANAFVMKLGQAPCDNMILVFDSVANVSCANSQGYAIARAYNGAAPYTYIWNTVPAVADSTIHFPGEGQYQVTATDAEGCSKVASVLIGARAPGNVFDLQTSLICTPIRSGFNGNIRLDASNHGCAPTSGQLFLVIDHLINFNFATPAPDAINGDTLVWDFSNFTYDIPHFMPYISFTASQSAAIGDSIHLTTIVTPTVGDIFIPNNERNYIFPVINSYDPNDKNVYPTGQCEEGFITNGQLLTYTIRFQNTGNADAINIHVVDSLTSFLNLNTVKILGSSHSMYTEVLPNNTLNFVFNDIHLPDSASNEPASHGYVIFEVMPNSNLSTGTKIENTVGIYFDFNEPVITNTTLNTIAAGNVICNASVNENITENVVSAYPNPTNDLLYIKFSEAHVNASLKCIDISGKVLMQKGNLQGELIPLDVSALSTGIYFLEINSGKNISRIKFIKQ